MTTATQDKYVGKHKVVSLTESAQTILAERFTTAKGTLRRYRHAIQDVVNGDTHDTSRYTAPLTPQARIKTMLKGKVGLSFEEQESNFRQCIELTTSARAGNIKAQSARAIAEKAIHVIEARREAQAGAATSEADWQDDEGDDSDSWGDD